MSNVVYDKESKEEAKGNRSRPQGGERFKFENNAFEISKGLDLEFVPYIPSALSISSSTIDRSRARTPSILSCQPDSMMASISRWRICVSACDCCSKIEGRISIY